MSDFADERAEVSIERSVLLWCMRVWVLGQRRRIGAAWRVENALSGLGAPDAAPVFAGFMHAVLDGGQVRMNCVCWRGVSADEHVLLDALALAQELRPMEALLLLRGLLAAADVAYLALDRATSVGAALARAGWFLGAPTPGMRQFAISRVGAPTPPRRAGAVTQPQCPHT